MFDAPIAETNLEAGGHTLKFTYNGSDEKSKGKRLMLDKLEVVDTTATKPAN